MKIIKLLLLLSIVSIAAVSGFAQNSADEVKSLERAWLNAYEKHDAKAMNTILADDFKITFSDGSMQTKANLIASLKPSPTMSAKFSTEDVQARVYGDTVVLTGRLVVVLTGRLVSEYLTAGKPAVKQYSRYTD
ncbi:MAG TPA: nuclear transport factor 2 family protein, partial [Pyrinomonadaceae bacterium]|nr:nuclear transport factor 2 family protein [Pyrinomonadaceae bacterium]